ncbi:hypothetical protein [Pleionea sp. CnH1-48]|uniref:hypothetical protein n=1 Tax=Pleionea sp. CnH1-48 TaxID=2954494 RepID=UPI002097B524|nr:hypothetical protein [Pleionea sp. CnH1-48]MCO7227531.1 hypothetical protein [Pleionea sp. CnH1-48]
MNIAELKKILIEKNVSESSFSIGLTPKESVVCIYEEHGKYIVAYNCKFSFVVLGEYDSESEACEHFLIEVLDESDVKK